MSLLQVSAPGRHHLHRTTWRTLFANPHIARLLVELFEARFDPSRRARAEAETERLRGR